MSDAFPPAPPPIDWGAVIGELKAMAEGELGTRAQKVTDVLGAADHSDAGIAAAIDQVARMTVRFVDPLRLDDLAQSMRMRLAERAGRPIPARLSHALGRMDAIDEVTVPLSSNYGCMEHTLLCLGLVVVVASVLESIPAL